MSNQPTFLSRSIRGYFIIIFIENIDITTETLTTNVWTHFSAITESALRIV